MYGNAPFYEPLEPLSKEEREFFVKEFGSVDGTYRWLMRLGGVAQDLYFQRVLVNAFRAGVKYAERGQ